jgi:hypothetical protein
LTGQVKNIDMANYSVSFSPDVAGIALRVVSTSDAELASHIPSMTVYEGEDSLVAFSDKVILFLSLLFSFCAVAANMPRSSSHHSVLR